MSEVVIWPKTKLIDQFFYLLGASLGIGIGKVYKYRVVMRDGKEMHFTLTGFSPYHGLRKILELHGEHGIDQVFLVK